MEIRLEDNLDIEVEQFSDYDDVEMYLKSNMTIKFIVVTCEESAKDLMDQIHSLPNVSHVFVYSPSDLNTNYPKIRNSCTPPLSALLKQIEKAINFNRYE
jgi:nitrate reductase NapAB chaperone NapD